MPQSLPVNITYLRRRLILGLPLKKGTGEKTPHLNTTKDNKSANLGGVVWGWPKIGGGGRHRTGAGETEPQPARPTYWGQEGCRKVCLTLADPKRERGGRRQIKSPKKGGSFWGEATKKPLTAPTKKLFNLERGGTFYNRIGDHRWRRRESRGERGTIGVHNP